MNFIIGGHSQRSQDIIAEAINYFEKRFAKTFNYIGISEKNYFIGIVKEKGKEISNYIIEDNEIIKSNYSIEVFRDTININKNKLKSFLSEISHDFIYGQLYKDQNGIRVFVDKFARHKIYYSLKKPFLFSTSLKFLYSIYNNLDLNYEVLNSLLFYGINIGKNTLFSQIFRLDSGEYLQILDSNIKIKKYWDSNKEFFSKIEHSIKDLSFWIDYIYETYKEAINWPIKNPCVSLLSGGIDSTILTSLFVREFDIPIKALSLKIPGFNEKDIRKARLVAKYLDIPHIIIEPNISNPTILLKEYNDALTVLEEPVFASGFLSRFHILKEVSKLDENIILSGDGGDDALGYIKSEIINKYKWFHYLYKIPIQLRKNLRKILIKFLNIADTVIQNRKLIQSLDIVANTDILISQNDLVTFFTSFQCLNSESIHQITGLKRNLIQILKPVLNECKKYPFNDLNEICYHRLSAIINGDYLVILNIANYFALKPFNLISNDIFWKKIVPMPQIVKLKGDRDRWILYEMAKKKKLLPQEFFQDLSYHGFKQPYMEKDYFEHLKQYIRDLIIRNREKSLVSLKPFEDFINISYKELIKHSPNYRKFNIAISLLGWLFTLF
ncbi:MAG: asparagine synthase-related protein [Candidatus Hodarchaeota archaeon]